MVVSGHSENIQCNIIQALITKSSCGLYPVAGVNINRVKGYCQPNITGRIIGRIRVQRGMSQEVLSGLAGVARSHLAMIENGSKNANVETLWRIAAALDMRMSELMRMVEDEIPQENHLTKP